MRCNKQNKPTDTVIYLLQLGAFSLLRLGRGRAVSRRLGLVWGRSHEGRPMRSNSGFALDQETEQLPAHAVKARSEPRELVGDVQALVERRDLAARLGRFGVSLQSLEAVLRVGGVLGQSTVERGHLVRELS